MDIPEIKYAKILYATDLSETGRHAFIHAASLSHFYGAELTVFHVVDVDKEHARQLIGYMSEELWQEIKNRELEEAKTILINRKRDNAVIRESIDDYCNEIQHNHSKHNYVAYNIVVKTGNPVKEIIKQIEKETYDLIVMGNLGHNPLHDAIMGSTVTRTLRRSKIPVLVVKIPHAEK